MIFKLLQSKRNTFINFFAFCIAMVIIFTVLPLQRGLAGNGGGGGGTSYTPIWQDVRGYGQSEVVGPISLNCLNANECATSNYKVEIDKGRIARTSSAWGDLKGRAWNPTVGWISFDKADTTGCPASASGSCSPRVNWNTGNIDGWAKILSCPVGGSGLYTQTAQLAGTLPVGYAGFGGQISSAVSTQRVLIGATADIYSASAGSLGAAYIFEKQGNTWAEVQRLTASDGQNRDSFGIVDISSDGSLVVVGAQYANGNVTDSGAAYIFEKQGSSWVQTQKLIASDSATSDSFGGSVEIYDNNTIVLGAWGDDDRGTDSGAAYIFEKQGSSWVQTQKLIASDGATSDGFGRTLSSEGLTLVIGGSNEAYVFEKQGSSWVQTYKLPLVSNGALGLDVELQGSTIFVGSPIEMFNSNLGAGAVHVFEKQGNVWNETGILRASDFSMAIPGNHKGTGFGSHLDVSGNMLVIRASDDSNAAGAAYIFEKQGSSWVQTQKLIASDASSGSYFGIPTIAQGGDIIIGAPYKSPLGGYINQGGAYVFQKPNTCTPWISLSCLNDNSCATSNYQVKVDKTTGLFSGYAWGGSGATGGTGWIDFSGATANLITSFGCYLPDQYGRKMVYFNGTQIGHTPPSTNRLQTQASALDENKITGGYYKVTMATYDNHSGYDIDPGEQWNLKFPLIDLSTLTTENTPDLPSYTSYAEYTVHDEFVVEADSVSRPYFYGVYGNAVPEGGTDALDPNYDNGFAPACAAFDYICPFGPEPGRTIVTFTDDQGDLPAGRGAYLEQGETENELVSLPAGSYTVHLASFDNHSAKAGGSTEMGDGDGPEGWALKACSGTTGCNVGSPNTLASASADDLLATNDQGITTRNITTTQPISSISAYPGSSNSGYKATAVCAAFDAIAAPTVTLTGTPAPSGSPLAIQREPTAPNNTVSIAWNIEGEYSSCAFTSSKTGNATYTDATWNAFSGTCPGATCPLATSTHSHTFTAAGDYYYNLTCQNQGAVAPAASARVYVFPNSGPLSVSLTPAVQGIAPNGTTVINYSILGDYSGGCDSTSSVTGDTTWENLANFFIPPVFDVSGSHTTPSLSAGIHTYTLSCRNSAGTTITGTAIINAPPQCDDGSDNDNDGFVDEEDRGCWADPVVGASTYDEDDNSEGGENICIIDNICQFKYGENPFTCKEDCAVRKLKDQ